MAGSKPVKISYTFLEQYLNDAAQKGSSQGEGEFSLSKRAALSKLSKFQLPFKGGWAAKLVQAGVAEESCTEIRVSQRQRVTQFHFEGLKGWSLDGLEEAITNPGFSENRSLAHLGVGLRALAVNQRRPFEIDLAGTRKSLIWDGEELRMLDGDNVGSGALITISNSSPQSVTSLIGPAHEHALVSKVLTERAYTAPIPVRLDSRLITGLEWSPTHGWRSCSHIHVSTYDDARLPPIKLPAPCDPCDAPLINQSESAFRVQGTPYTQHHSTAVALLSGLHFRPVTGERKARFQRHQGKCLVQWVLDGVALEPERVTSHLGQCSFCCFADAGGLKTDLTTLQLLGSPKKTARRRLVLGFAWKCLKDVQPDDFQRLLLAPSKLSLLATLFPGLLDHASTRHRDLKSSLQELKDRLSSELQSGS